MDFIGIIRSLEELLYEVMSWLIFYPRTLWRMLTNPAAVPAYSDAEQNDRPDEQYTDTLSPPLLLMITMVLTYGLAHAIGAAVPPSIARRCGSRPRRQSLAFRPAIKSDIAY